MVEKDYWQKKKAIILYGTCKFYFLETKMVENLTKTSDNWFWKDMKRILMPIAFFFDWLFSKLLFMKFSWSKMISFYKLVKKTAMICFVFCLKIRKLRTRNIFLLIIVVSIFLFLIQFGHELNIYFQYLHPEKQCFPPKQQHDNIRYMIHSFDKVMSKHGLVYWIDFGTLLGTIRYKDVIPWDFDGDISYLLSDLPKMKTLVVPDLRNKYGIYANEDNFVKMVYNGSTVDLFQYTTYALLKNVANHPRHSNSTLTRAKYRLAPWLETYADTEKEFALPPIKCLFAGQYVNCPAKPKEILRHRYPNVLNQNLPYKLQCWLPWNLWKIWLHGIGEVI